MIIKKYNFGIKQYLYNDVFSKDDKNFIISHLEENFFNIGKIEKKYPGYQTLYDHNLFQINYDPFEKLKKTFIQSCKDYVNISKIKFNIDHEKYESRCWCYLNWKDSNRSDQEFHIHNRSNPFTISGIFYLKMPDDDENVGTKFLLGGNLITLPSITNSWFIFPSNYGHIPGNLTNTKKRYVISADLWFTDYTFNGII